MTVPWLDLCLGTFTTPTLSSMPKGGFVEASQSSAPVRATRRRSYVLWIVAAALSIVAIRNFLLPGYLQTSQTWSLGLDGFQKLNSLSPVAEGDFTDNGNEPGPKQRAVVTTLYSEAFASGALALGYSLRAVNTSARRILIYYPDRLTVRTLCHLESTGWELHPIPYGQDKTDERYLKIESWTLDLLGIKSVVYLDSTVLVRNNFDELWSLPFNFAAVPEVYENGRGFSPDFSAGMMFLRTSSSIYNDMLGRIAKRRNFDFQRFLNEYFAVQVVKLPYIYNANLVIKQRTPALWSALTDHMRIVRYTAARPFFEEERKRAVQGPFKAEMGWWESTWRETFKELVDRC